MLKSMTAYGRGSLDTEHGHFVIEILSVNRKHLEVNVVLPRELSQFDVELKNWLKPYIARGQITIKVSVMFQGTIPFTVQPNLPLARQLKSVWDDIAKDLKLEDNFDLNLLKDAEGLLIFEENLGEHENYRNFLRVTLEKALKGFLQMKVQEGTVLQDDIFSRLDKMREAMRLIEKKTPLATSRYREKLMARLEEVLPGKIENEERILREVALFAEKIDITEEITRFFCHLNHFEEVCRAEEISVGKTLEFLVQELNREANTIGSKSSELEITRSVIEIKSELERIREQIQNIE